jgi:hypothetical protein
MLGMPKKYRNFAALIKISSKKQRNSNEQRHFNRNGIDGCGFYWVHVVDTAHTRRNRSLPASAG